MKSCAIIMRAPGRSPGKGALIQRTRAMAAHHGREGIRVHGSAPGMVYTPMVATRGMTAEQREARRRRSLARRLSLQLDCS